MFARPFSPETLGNRWDCSAEKIRQMCKQGELSYFRLGKLIRIPANEVDRVECQNTVSSDTEANGASLSPIRREAAFESRLERLSGAPQRLALVQSGEPSPSHSQRG